MKPLKFLYQYHHKTQIGHLVFGIFELGIAYILGSIAIDTANMFAYFGASFLFVVGLSDLIHVFIHERKRAKR